MSIKTETLDVSIGRRVAAARMAIGCCTNEAAARLNISEADYNARELGDQRFRSRDLSTLAGLLSVEIRSFFEDESLATKGVGATREFALSDWVKASRRREGLNALLQSDEDAESGALSTKAA
ncbi:MAG: hypothetical protein AAFQ15_07370 [Pseudomonadota bacterium]